MLHSSLIQLFKYFESKRWIFGNLIWLVMRYSGEMPFYYVSLVTFLYVLPYLPFYEP